MRLGRLASVDPLAESAARHVYRELGWWAWESGEVWRCGGAAVGRCARSLSPFLASRFITLAHLTLIFLEHLLVARGQAVQFVHILHLAVLVGVRARRGGRWEEVRMALDQGLDQGLNLGSNQGSDPSLNLGSDLGTN